MKSNEELLYLFERYISKNYTAAEKQELMELLADPAYDAQWNAINDRFENVPEMQQMLAGSNSGMAWEAIRERTVAGPTQPAIVKPFYRKWWAAAIALLLVSAAGYFWTQTDKEEKTQSLAKQKMPVVPGEAGAILKLDDGRVILLDSSQKGLVASNAAARAVVDNGSLTYQPLQEASGSEEVIYNTMLTMRGKMYRMVLPDGTRVWLNASTQLRFPVAFNGDERRVRLQGEAYFEVAKNPSRPFIVEVEQRGEVKVLGTQFNISAYPDDNRFTTTLLDGKVQSSSLFRDSKGKEQIVTLTPSFQSIMQSGKDLVVQKADLEQTMAWKDGRFVFKSAKLSEVFSQLGRWYDVQFVNEENIDDAFSGSMYRTDDFYELLKLIEFTSNVNCRAEGRTVIVTRKK
ncbi:FecR family protein [Pseudoflavitalea rhizosphaerae]|uniref:FecR family protein n=1 Tax=Pseudoflavitalea rhizosphaerae TaxID=1884793 RepID=UPI000F8F4A1C|nr:FecR domain-containing protein [Pseudoflavitalea rhizosphaerae]